MEKYEIDKLIEKYFDATSTLEEEQKLRLYFTSEKIDNEHKAIAGLFSFYNAESELINDKEVISMIPKQKKNTPVFYLSRIAAAAMIIFAVYFSYNAFEQPVDNDMVMVDDPEEAYRVTMEALAFLSNKYEKGNKPLENIKKLKNTQIIK
jgi:hypothetical protein